ncbi:MAG: outer membrane beta-barrel protein [Verrucomicrobiota bacterium]
MYHPLSLLTVFGIFYTASSILTGSALADAGPPAPGTKDLEQVVETVHSLETANPGIRLSGYVDVGYLYNFTSATPNTQGYAADGGRQGDFNVNAVKVLLEKPLAGNADQLEAGFRVDLMLGEDAQGFSGFGAAGSGDALYVQQAYIEINLPYGDGINIITGRFNSLLGFEADERPDNINITQGFNASVDPGPGNGVLASYALAEQLSIAGGVINGSGAWTNAGIDSEEEGYALTGAMAFGNTAGNAEAQMAFHWAPWGDAGVGAGQSQNEHLLGLNWTGKWSPHAFDKKLFLGYNASLWLGENYSTNNSSALFTTSCYAKYQWNKIFHTAGRFEYTHNNDGQITGLTGTGGADDLYGCTGTLGFDLIEDILVRAEYRADWGNDVTTGGEDLAHTVAIQAVYSF